MADWRGKKPEKGTQVVLLLQDTAMMATVTDVIPREDFARIHPDKGWWYDVGLHILEAKEKPDLTEHEFSKSVHNPFPMEKPI